MSVARHSSQWGVSARGRGKMFRRRRNGAACGGALLRKAQKILPRPAARTSRYRIFGRLNGLPQAKRRRFAWGSPDKKKAPAENDRSFGDPDENRTRVTAVKGRCLDRLTTGPYIKNSAWLFLLSGSGSGIRTYDQSGMNRVL